MRRAKALILCGMIAAGLTLIGCSKSSTGPDRESLTSDEISQITDIIDSDALFDSGETTLNDGGAVSGDLQSLGKTATPVQPYAWGRKITGLSRSVDFERVNDSTVVATITYTFTGQFLIAARYTLQDTSVSLITKDFSQTTTRKAKFYKNALDRWAVREISAVQGTTQDSELTITQVDVISDTDTLSITDPTNTFMRLPRLGGQELLQFGVSSPTTVRVTLTSTSPDTDLVAIHRPWMIGNAFHPLRVRMHMISQQQSGSVYVRVYELSWNAHIAGRHHLFVDAVIRGTLFDDTAAVSAQLWGIPFIVQ
jgi:hypothetical protein